MADKVVVVSLLPPAVAVEKMNKMAPDLLPAVKVVSLWALLTAGILFGSYVFAITMVHYHIQLPSPGTAKLTDDAEAEADEDEVSAIIQGLLWCSAAAAATATLALLLPGRRRVLACVCVALAATATIHLMLARGLAVTFVFTTDLGDILWWILATFAMFFLVAGDIICFLGLLGRVGLELA